MVSQDLFTHVNSEKSRASKEDLKRFPLFFGVTKCQGPGDFVWRVGQSWSFAAWFLSFFFGVKDFVLVFLLTIFWKNKMQLNQFRYRLHSHRRILKVRSPSGSDRWKTVFGWISSNSIIELLMTTGLVLCLILTQSTVWGGYLHSFGEVTISFDYVMSQPLKVWRTPRKWLVLGMIHWSKISKACEETVWELPNLE